MKGDVSDGLATPEVISEGDRPPKVFLTDHEVRCHAIGFLLAIAVILGVLFRQLSTDSDAPSTSTVLSVTLLAAACGGLIHSATSFSTFAGNRELVRSWLPWFYLRPAIGMLLGLLVYLAAQAEMFAMVDLTSPKLAYKLAFLGGITGLFSKQVTDKLSDMMSSLLALANPPERKDALGEKISSQSKTGAAIVDSSGEYSDLIRSVQTQLIARGDLAAVRADGQPADSGLLSDDTRHAIDRFLSAAGVDDADREAVMGDEFAPDYWPALLKRLEATKK